MRVALNAEVRVEMKRSLSASVVAQAMNWTMYAHYVSVATPETTRHTKGHSVLSEYMMWKGIGHIEVLPRYLTYLEHGNVTDLVAMELVEPRLNRKAWSDGITDALTKEHKTYAEAGNSDGKYWTPFKKTAEMVRSIVKSNPGCTTKFLVDNCKHHYAASATFKSLIPRYILSDVIKGVRIDDTKKPYRYYPEDNCIEEND